MRIPRPCNLRPPTTPEKGVYGSSVPVAKKAVTSPRAGTYEYPGLVVGAAPGSLPTTLEKSVYRRFFGAPRTPRIGFRTEGLSPTLSGV
ncbi:hypothetical protein MA16_Dca012717 [Dendrobium catenatum]|uniref:Uncharacterized protein n=1 Tax=Dendrobium catenatum TaxID=906689 RepID=A0A2I0V7K4_9ASPA|nr:hypothetical protein MA16_Dca012717 [Dendrobium catenatum]